jgi:hypothetical protein
VGGAFRLLATPPEGRRVAGEPFPRSVPVGGSLSPVMVRSPLLSAAPGSGRSRLLGSRSGAVGGAGPGCAPPGRGVAGVSQSSVRLVCMTTTTPAPSADPMLVTVHGMLLRSVLLVALDAARGRSLSVAELCAAVHRRGFTVAGRPGKVVSDAVRCEVVRGRVRRVARGHYCIVWLPRTTRWRCHRRIRAARAGTAPVGHLHGRRTRHPPRGAATPRSPHRAPPRAPIRGLRRALRRAPPGLRCRGLCRARARPRSRLRLRPAPTRAPPRPDCAPRRPLRPRRTPPRLVPPSGAPCGCRQQLEQHRPAATGAARPTVLRRCGGIHCLPPASPRSTTRSEPGRHPRRAGPGMVVANSRNAEGTVPHRGTGRRRPSRPRRRAQVGHGP